MGHGDDGAGVLGEVLLEPRDRLGVEVVRRLVEEEHVGLLQEQAHHRHAALLAPRERPDDGVGRGRAEGVHGLLELGVEVPEAEAVDVVLELGLPRHQGVEVGVGVGELLVDGLVVLEDLDLVGGAFLDDLADGLRLVEHRLLVEHPEGDAFLQDLDGAGVVGVLARDELEERRFARAVEAEHADLGAVVEGEPDVLEDGLAGLVRLRDAAHREDDLLVGHGEGGDGDRRRNPPVTPRAALVATRWVRMGGMGDRVWGLGTNRTGLRTCLVSAWIAGVVLREAGKAGDAKLFVYHLHGPCHCERSAAIRVENARRSRLPRRCAPRNDRNGNADAEP